MTSMPTQEQQTLPIPSPQIEEANSSPLQDGSATGIYIIMYIELFAHRYSSVLNTYDVV